MTAIRTVLAYAAIAATITCMAVGLCSMPHLLIGGSL
jgi:hypothetical protein